MNEKLALRRYAKKPLGTYPEVDNFIIHDPKATKAEFRYLVAGEEFASSLTMAREKMAARLQLNDPKIVAATEVLYKPATGFTYPHRNKTDEGEQQMARTPQTVEAANKKLTQAKKELEEIKSGLTPNLSEEEKATLQVDIRRAEDRVDYHTRAVRAAEAGMSVRAYEKKLRDEKQKPNAETVKPAAKATPNKTAIAKPVSKKLDKGEPVTKDGITTQLAHPPRTKQLDVPQPPMMIETGGIKITVHGADQMDMAISSLKKHNVI